MKYKKLIIFILTSMCILTVGCVKFDGGLFKKKLSSENNTQVVYCSECGYSTTKMTKYCPNCGKEAKWVTEKPEQNTSSINNNSNNNNSSNNNQSTQNNSQKHSNTQNTISKRDEYLNKLDEIKCETDNLYESCGESNAEIRETQEIVYKKWDDMLNEIYSRIKTDLNSTQADNLKNKERAWIKYRDKKAENDAQDGEGGNMYSILYSYSIIETTKERCYELVNEYME